MKKLILSIISLSLLGGCAPFPKNFVKGAAFGMHQCPSDYERNDTVIRAYPHWGIAAGIFFLNPLAGIVYLGGSGIVCGVMGGFQTEEPAPQRSEYYKNK